MSKQVAEALDGLRRSGSPDEMRALAERGFGPKSRPRVNSHIHLPPNFSAFDSVEQAVELAATEQVQVVGVSNYYDYDVYGEFVERSRSRGIFPLFGLEIISMQADLRDAGVKVNDPGNPGKTYLCGKGITRFADMTAEATRLIDTIRKNDSARMAAMVARMRAALAERGLAVEVDEAGVIEMIVRRHGSRRETVYLQERHISQAFQEALFELVPDGERVETIGAAIGATPQAIKGVEDFVGVQNELRSQLMKAGKPAFVDEAFLTFAEARRLVLELGGVPSYPVLGDGTSPLCAFEADADKLIASLKERGVYATEWIPVRNSASFLAEYVTKIRAAGMVVTAGTEHNTLDLIPLGPTCKDGDVPSEIQAIFWEGACVVAAHQFLTLHGEVGYVDANGKPTVSGDAGIKSLAQLGAAVIGRYFEQCVAA
jgi:hypothetical protein